MSTTLPDGRAAGASVSDLTAGRRKRLKIAVACEPCRAKKIKCDGVTPVCNPCARKFGKSDQCRYISASAHAGSQSRTEKKTHANISKTQDRPTPSRRTAAVQSRQLPVLRPTERPSERHGLRASHTTYVESVTEPETTVDSMNAIVEGQSTEFFGGSSAGSFTGQIKAAIEERMSQVRPATSTGLQRQTSRLNRRLSSKRRPIDLSSQVLPPRRLADELMSIYWTYIAPLYPFLDRQRWESNYAGVFTGSSTDMDEGLFLATMNVIFALSTQLREDMDKQNREDNSNAYFERASEPLHGMMLDSGSVELVQYLLLTAQYLQCTSSPHHTWMVVGSACRIAQSLGLHLSATSDSTPSFRQREVYRRLWHGCVLLDRMVSFTHGRPVMIDAKLAGSVPLPQSASDAAELEGMTEPAFFIKSLQLYEITHELTVSLYPASSMKSKKTPGSTFQELAEIVRIDGLLSEWEETVPQQLIVKVAESNGATPLREAVILRLRMLHTRILLLRPTLALMCLSKSQTKSDDANNSLQRRIYQQCAQVCVETAQSIISLIVNYATSDGTVGLLPAWWYRLYYLFAASTVLIAAKLRPDLFQSTDIDRSWKEAIDTLKKLGDVSDSAQKCIAALHMLAAKVLQTSEAESASMAADIWKPVLPEIVEGSIDPLQTGITDAGFDFDLTNNFPIDFVVDVDDLSWLNYMATWNGPSEWSTSV